ncbi:hypothetical protein QCM77_03800 [Bradyrhizobium sp. SSUT18]|uniref:hypothetical protein n=1 Tax=Bradyrhizobium sp. SSUT18 TaxID=3040602 RepID=UPI00244B6960|nr:hypothetical protein [Bradyrhizobium sp. SSUT18]MDH2399088.1 hypothetical protein [Bradyrhizobium sp. SSUT18]
MASNADFPRPISAHTNNPSQPSTVKPQTTFRMANPGVFMPNLEGGDGRQKVRRGQQDHSDQSDGHAHQSGKRDDGSDESDPEMPVLGDLQGERCLLGDIFLRP